MSRYEARNSTGLNCSALSAKICRDCDPQLIKIDIEGAELLALRGARETLMRSSPRLIVSVHPEAMRALGTSPRELMSFLDGLGFEGRHLDGRHAIEPGFEEVVFVKAPR